MVFSISVITKNFKMKYLRNITLYILLIITTVGFSADVTPSNEVEKKLLDFFAKWRSGDTASLPFSLPSLQTLYIPPLRGNYSGKGVKLTYSSSRMRVVGMNYFSVAELDVSLSNMRASGALVIPLLGISADNYNVEGRALYVYSLRGSGKLHAIFKNVKLVFAIGLTGNGTHPNVNQFDLNFDIGDIQVDLENSSWPMNKVLNKEGVKIIEGYHEDIVTATEQNLVQRLDTYLNTVTPAQLLYIMHQHLEKLPANNHIGS